MSEGNWLHYSEKRSEMKRPPTLDLLQSPQKLAAPKTSRYLAVSGYGWEAVRKLATSPRDCDRHPR